MKRPLRTEAEKIEIVDYWQAHGMKATVEKYGHADVTIYTWNRERGLYPTTGKYKCGKPTRKKRVKKEEKALAVPEMIEIKAEDYPAGSSFTLFVPKLVIRTKNVEVISE